MMQLSDIRYKLLLLFIDDMMIETNGENGRMISVNRGKYDIWTTILWICACDSGKRIREYKRCDWCTIKLDKCEWC